MGASGSIGVVERAALEADLATFCEQKPRGRERVLSYDTAWCVCILKSVELSKRSRSSPSTNSPFPCSSLLCSASLYSPPLRTSAALLSVSLVSVSFIVVLYSLPHSNSEVLSHLGEVQVETQCFHCSRDVGALNLEIILEEVRERGFSLEDQPFLYDGNGKRSLLALAASVERDGGKRARQLTMLSLAPLTRHSIQHIANWGVSSVPTKESHASASTWIRSFRCSTRSSWRGASLGGMAMPPQLLLAATRRAVEGVTSERKQLVRIRNTSRPPQLPARAPNSCHAPPSHPADSRERFQKRRARLLARWQGRREGKRHARPR